MKAILRKISPFIASFALMIVTANVNSCCMYIMHQPVLPKEAEKLKHI